MDFQQFDDLNQMKETNVINLDCIEEGDQNEGKEAEKRWKNLHFFSSHEILPDSLDAEIDGHEFKKVKKRSSFLEAETHFKDQGYFKHEHEQYPKRRNIKETPREEIKMFEKKAQNSTLSTNKYGEDIIEKPKLKQLAEDCSQELLKLCMLEAKNYSIEEILREINQVNQLKNPSFKKKALNMNERKYKNQTSLDIQHQLSMLASSQHNSSQNSSIIVISAGQQNHFHNQYQPSRFNKQAAQGVNQGETNHCDEESGEKITNYGKRENEKVVESLAMIADFNIDETTNVDDSPNLLLFQKEYQCKNTFQKRGNNIKSEIFNRDFKRDDIQQTENDQIDDFYDFHPLQRKSELELQNNLSIVNSNFFNHKIINRTKSSTTQSEFNFIGLVSVADKEQKKLKLNCITSVEKYSENIEQFSEKMERNMIQNNRKSSDSFQNQQGRKEEQSQKEVENQETKRKVKMQIIQITQEPIQDQSSDLKKIMSSQKENYYDKSSSLSSSQSSFSSGTSSSDGSDQFDDTSNLLNISNKKLQRKSQSCEEFFNVDQIKSLEQNLKNDKVQAINLAPAQLKKQRSNTICFEYEKRIFSNKLLGQGMNPFTDQPSKDKGSFRQLLKEGKMRDEKQQQQEFADPYKLFKERPMHVIEDQFYEKQTSFLKAGNQLLCSGTNQQVFVLGNKGNPDMKDLRVYFFNMEDVFLDFILNLQQTSIGQFIKFIISSFKSNKALNQSQLRYPDFPQRYKIYPNIGESAQEKHLADINIPELSDYMMLQDAIGDCSECCFIEVDECMQESISMSQNQIEDHQQELKEFQIVYSKEGEMVFKVECREKEFSTIIRVGKDKLISDLFENIQKKKKIDIDKRNFFVQGKAFGSDNLVELDLRMPLSLVSDQILKICRREFEDRQGGTVEEKIIQSNNGNFLNNFGNTFEESPLELDEDFVYSDLEETDANQYNFALAQASKINNKKQITLQGYELLQLSQYEEFEVTKITYVSNEVYKRSKRIIGIDEQFIYNRKVQPNKLSLRNLLCFFFPASPCDTKCPTKKIDDIKDMYIIDGTNLLLQFYEKDSLKYWLLFNSNLAVSRRMFEKLTYLRKSIEVRIF